MQNKARTLRLANTKSYIQNTWTSMRIQDSNAALVFFPLHNHAGSPLSNFARYFRRRRTCQQCRTADERNSLGDVCNNNIRVLINQARCFRAQRVRIDRGECTELHLTKSSLAEQNPSQCRPRPEVPRRRRRSPSRSWASRSSCPSARRCSASRRSRRRPRTTPSPRSRLSEQQLKI